MLESIITGAIQGIAEWLPVSSEGLLVLFKINLSGFLSITDLISFALLLHLGTSLSALIYFRKDVYKLFKTFFKYQKAERSEKELFKFILISSIISGSLGIFIFKGIESIGGGLRLEFAARDMTIIVGVLLLVTGFIQMKRRGISSTREIRDLNPLDAIVLGVVQALTIIPGFSRSGFTISALLLRKVKETDALKLSFIMSLPASLGANILFNFNNLSFSVEKATPLLSAFFFGILTIHLLIKLSQKLNFAWFVIIFGIITILSTLI